uniref:Mediator of RNA polymerase II transcription subunit 19 n=1 Tax=Strongyloides venezuelensis TaxID=75913 RepID=A0A0K0FUY7_STRVS
MEVDEIQPKNPVTIALINETVPTHLTENTLLTTNIDDSNNVSKYNESKKIELAKKLREENKKVGDKFPGFYGVMKKPPNKQKLLGSDDILSIYNLRECFDKVCGKVNEGDSIYSILDEVIGPLENETYKSDSSSLRKLIERPPIVDKEIINFTDQMLKFYDLQPGALDKKYQLEGNAKEIASRYAMECSVNGAKDKSGTNGSYNGVPSINFEMYEKLDSGVRLKKKNRTKEEKEERARRKAERKEKRRLEAEKERFEELNMIKKAKKEEKYIESEKSFTIQTEQEDNEEEIIR